MKNPPTPLKILSPLKCLPSRKRYLWPKSSVLHSEKSSPHDNFPLLLKVEVLMAHVCHTCDCIKTVQAIGLRNLHCGCRKDSSLLRQNFVPVGPGVPLEWESQGYPLKWGYFAVITLYSVKTVANRYRHAAYHNKHWWQAFRFINIDDLERPWSPSPKRGC